jgi:DNA-binding NtrC family response regulator
MSDRIPTIAVVDDEQEIVTMIERFLTRDKAYRVNTYLNPVTALNSIRKDVDLVLLDVMMPQMDGLELLRQLHERYPDMKIVMMTAYSTLDKVLNAHRYGATSYIMKPFSSLDDFKQKIDDVLKG